MADAAGGKFEAASVPKKAKKSRRRPTLARASPALPSAMGRLTSVFGMGTGVTAPLWPPAKGWKWELKRTTTHTRTRERFIDLTSCEVGFATAASRTSSLELLGQLELLCHGKSQNKLSHTPN